jgi:hypothetical protein
MVLWIEMDMPKRAMVLKVVLDRNNITMRVMQIMREEIVLQKSSLVQGHLEKEQKKMLNC